MAVVDAQKGVWKSGKGKGRHTPKGRQLDDVAHKEITELLGDRPRQRDLLIEYLHLIQDKYGHLSAAHLRALAEEMSLSMAEVYEVASFYAHFDIVKEGETAPPALTIRVCDSLTCEMAGAEKLLADLGAKYSAGKVRILRAPCMGRCDTAPVLELGHNHIDHADLKKVEAAIVAGNIHPHIPDYETVEAYYEAGRNSVHYAMMTGEVSVQTVIKTVKKSGLRGLGGAGFPTARKWELVRAEKGPRYLAVNADEGEPGTFKDRYYLEREPLVFLEGMLIAARVIDAEKCFIYLRDEYPAVRKILQTEIAKLEVAGIFPVGYFNLRRDDREYRGQTRHPASSPSLRCAKRHIWSPDFGA